MPRSIEGSLADGGRIVDDLWLMVETADALRLAPDAVSLLVPHQLWSSQRDSLIARGTPVGVVLEPNEDPATLVADLSRLAMIAIRFPKFTDGRGSLDRAIAARALRLSRLAARGRRRAARPAVLPASLRLRQLRDAA